MSLFRSAPRPRRARPLACVALLAGLPLLSLGVAAPLSAQPLAVRSIEAVVRDGSGAVVPGATVVLVDLGTGQTRVSATDATGRVKLLGTLPTRAELSVSAPGFAADVRALDLSAAEGAQLLDIALRPAAVVDQVTVVSGSRQEELREQTSAAVAVVSRTAMRDTGYESVGEVLREVPGVLTRRGSESSSTAGEQIQGIDSRGVLVLLDGLPVVGARGIKRGVLNLDRQSVGRLDRVEIVKGASSALYGSDAIGGVINLITRDPRQPLESLFTVSAGSTGAFDARGEVGSARGAVSTYVTLERHQRDAWDLTPSTADTTGADFKRNDALAKLTFQIRPDLRLTALGNGYWNQSKGRSVGELGTQSDDAKDDAQNAALKGEWQMGSSLSLEARGYYARYDETSTSALVTGTTPLEPGELYERYSRGDATVRWVAAGQLVQGGVEFSSNDYRGHNRLRDDAGHTAETTVVWVQDQVSLANRLTVTGGLRYDHHSIFGEAWSPKLGINVRASDSLRLRGSYGRGFRAPDLGQLYYRFLNPTNLYQVVGNPALRPERSGSVQIGGDYTFRTRRARLGVNLFRNDVDDLIESRNLGMITSAAQLQALAAAEGLDLSFNPQLFRLLFIYQNLNDVRTEGVEADGDIALPGGFSASAAYTYLHAKDRDTRLSLTGRHPHQGSLRLSWATDALGGWRANVRGAFFSQWIATRSGTTEVDGARFALWDLYVAKLIARGIECFGAVDNFTNSQDPNTGVIGSTGAPAAIYRPDLGRTVRFGVRWNLSSGGRP
jgi:outer membrane receptor for ferrienterochelin and colicins